MVLPSGMVALSAEKRGSPLEETSYPPNLAHLKMVLGIGVVINSFLLAGLIITGDEGNFVTGVI